MRLEPAATGPQALVATEEAELRRTMLLWWPARIAKDTGFFRRLLAPEFVRRAPNLHEGDTNRDDFVGLVISQSLCGGRLTVQERSASYHLLGPRAVVSISMRLWFGDPILSQTESEMFLLFDRRESRWQLVELRESHHQLPGALWEKPSFVWRRPAPGEQGRPSGPPYAYTLPRCPT